MKPFSKKADKAECPLCGQLKDTNLTPEERAQKGWECDECYQKMINEQLKKEPPVVPTKQTPKDLGSEEITKYHPSYQFLVKLVKLLGKEVPESIPEIKHLSESYPFVTVDDIGDLTAKIWTLATQKYKIPREWLISNLPKNASLKVAKAEKSVPRSEAQFSVLLFDRRGVQYFANEKDANDYYAIALKENKDPSKPTAFTYKKADLWPSQEAAEDMINHAPGYIPYQYGQDSDTSVSGPRPDEVDKKAKTLNINQIVQILNSKDTNKVVRIDTKNLSLELSDGTEISFDDAAKKAMDMSKEGVFSGSEFSNTEFNVNPTLDNGPFSSPQDQGATLQKKPFPNTMWDVATDDEDESQPYSNVASFYKRPFSKKANLPTKFWIAPDGTEFPMGGVHGHWIENNLKKLKQYGIDAKGKNLTQIWNEMTETGWARVSNEPAGTRFIIEVNDLSNLPSYLDSFIAKYYTQGEEITLGNGKGQYVKVNDPFPSIQKAVNKELTNPINASLKQAAISGTITNKILQAIHNNGGTTYNLTIGDMVGTPNFSVSVYPERERIVDGVDFDILEGFIDDNEDLLKDPANSLGAWTTDGKIYLDVVVTIPDQERAIDLAKQNNQIAIWDLQNGREISTGGTGGGQMPKAFSKKNLIKIADIGEWGGYWIGPNDKVYEMGENDEHWDWAYEEGIARIGEDPIKKGWVRARINETELIFQVNDLKNIPSTVDTFIAQHNGEVIQIDDYQKQRAEVEYTDALEHGIQKAVNKALIQTIKTSKTAEESLLSQDAQNQIASKSSPAYVIAVNNFAEAFKRGHEKDRSLSYAISSVQNLEKIDPKKLVEFINEYVVI